MQRGCRPKITVSDWTLTINGTIRTCIVIDRQPNSHYCWLARLAATFACMLTDHPGAQVGFSGLFCWFAWRRFISFHFSIVITSFGEEGAMCFSCICLVVLHVLVFVLSLFLLVSGIVCSDCGTTWTFLLFCFWCLKFCNVLIVFRRLWIWWQPTWP